MHEASLIRNLIRKVETIGLERHAQRVVGVKVRLGALAHISPDHFRDHFDLAAQGTLAEGARLDIESSADLADPHAQEILLQSVDIES